MTGMLATHLPTYDMQHSGSIVGSITHKCSGLQAIAFQPSVEPQTQQEHVTHVAFVLTAC